MYFISPFLPLSLLLSLPPPLPLLPSLFLSLSLIDTLSSYSQEIEGQQQQIQKLSTESREENIVLVAEHTHSLILGSNGLKFQNIRFILSFLEITALRLERDNLQRQLDQSVSDCYSSSNTLTYRLGL